MQAAMSNIRHRNERHITIFSVSHTLFFCATWTQATMAQSEAALAVASDTPLANYALIPSAPSRPSLIPSQPIGIIPSRSHAPELIPSQLPGLIPSQPPSIPTTPLPSSLTASIVPPGLIPSSPILIPSSPPPESVPSAPPGTRPSMPGLIPSGPINSGTDFLTPTISDVDETLVKPSMTSTEEPLRPIPAETTAPGDPNGHHEIAEPNFTITQPCKGCSPITLISQPGWSSWPLTTAAAAAEQGKVTTGSPQATVTAGSSNIIISKEPTGGNFVIGGSTTVSAGQTVIFDNTPVAIQTTGSSTEIIVGTETMRFEPPLSASLQTPITVAPILPTVTIGTQILTANSASEYIILEQTLTPGGSAVTVDGTTISLLPSATAIVVNGVTSTLAQAYGAVYTTTDTPLLTLNDHVYEANRAGYYVLGPGTTLVPGGAPVTVSGTVISLEPHGTVAVIQGSTSVMQPVTTVVTVTRGGGGGYGDGGGTGGDIVYSSDIPGILPYPTSVPDSASVILGVPGVDATDGWLEAVLVLGCFGLGWLAVWL